MVYNLNYWMRLCMIARIIKAEVCVVGQSRRLRQETEISSHTSTSKQLYF